MSDANKDHKHSIPATKPAATTAFQSAAAPPPAEEEEEDDPEDTEYFQKEDEAFERQLEQGLQNEKLAVQAEARRRGMVTIIAASEMDKTGERAKGVRDGAKELFRFITEEHVLRVRTAYLRGLNAVVSITGRSARYKKGFHYAISRGLEAVGIYPADKCTVLAYVAGVDN